MRTRKLILSTTGIVGLFLTSCSAYQLVNSQVYNDADLAEYNTFRIITPDAENMPPSMDLVTYYNIAAAIREQMMDRGYTEDPFSPIVINIGLSINKEVQTTSVGALMGPPPPPIARPIIVPVPRPSQGNGGGNTPPPPPPSGGESGPMPSDDPQPSVAQQAPATAPTTDTPQASTPAPATVNPHFFPYGGPAPIPRYAPYFMMPRSSYWGTGVNPATQVVTGIYREGVLTMDIVNIQTKTPLYSASVSTILDNGNTQFRDLKGIAEAVQTLFSKFPVPVLPQYRHQK